MMFSRLAVGTALVLAGCSQANDSAGNRSAWVADGPAVNCISTIQIRTIRVVDDQTIDFEMSGRQAFRNNLPFRCSGLTFNRGIRHNSRTSQLCSFNTFTVKSPGPASRGPDCRLGQFQPMKRAPVAASPVP